MDLTRVSNHDLIHGILFDSFIPEHKAEYLKCLLGRMVENDDADKAYVEIVVKEVDAVIHRLNWSQ